MAELDVAHSPRIGDKAGFLNYIYMKGEAGTHSCVRDDFVSLHAYARMISEKHCITRT